MERDTKEELTEAIREHLKDANFKVLGLSVLERVGGWEAWIIIEDYPHITGTE